MSAQTVEKVPFTVNQWAHEGVAPDGTISGGRGAVHTEGGIRRSYSGGGCDLRGCNCSEGHWLSVFEPRTEAGVVRGITFRFTNEIDLDRAHARLVRKSLSVNEALSLVSDAP